jgi:hypothetical protein
MSKSRRRDEGFSFHHELIDFFPLELLRYIVHESNEQARMRGRLSRTCHTINHFFRNDQKNEAAKKLMGLVLKGLPNKVMKMIEADAELLDVKARGVDLSGRTVEGTAYQVALGLDYYLIYQKMEPLFQKLLNGEMKRKVQFHEQFPEEMVFQYSFSELAGLVTADAFAGDQPSKKIKKEVKKFQASFAINPNEVVHKGYYFDLQILIDAAEAYKNHYDQMDVFQRKYFTIQVLGFLQWHFSVSAAQAFCQGLKKINNNKKPTQALKLVSGSSFFNRDDVRRRGLGFTDFINSQDHGSLESIWNPEDSFLENLKIYYQRIKDNRELVKANFTF